MSSSKHLFSKLETHQVSRWDLLWILAAICTNLVASIADSSFIHVWYTHGLFPKIRVIYDNTLGLIPFASIYLILPVTLYLLIKSLRSSWQHILCRQWLGAILRPLGFAAMMYSLFFWLWGFNYYGQDLKESAFEDFRSPSLTVVASELTQVTNSLIKLRNVISTDTAALDESIMPHDLEDHIRSQLTKDLSTLHAPTHGRVRVRQLRPTGLLLRLSTAGIYIPYSLEGHIDNGLHPLQVPVTLAHEMSHGYSVTDEGECNFTGILACLNSTNDFVRYSGLLSYWRYLFRAVKKRNKELTSRIYNELPSTITNDLDAIYRQMDLYPDLIPKVRNKVYDAYLKSHGVTAGNQSYGTVVDMMIHYQMEHGKHPLIVD